MLRRSQCRQGVAPSQRNLRRRQKLQATLARGGSASVVEGACGVGQGEATGVASGCGSGRTAPDITGGRAPVGGMVGWRYCHSSAETRRACTSCAEEGCRGGAGSYPGRTGTGMGALGLTPMAVAERRPSPAFGLSRSSAVVQPYGAIEGRAFRNTSAFQPGSGRS